MATLLIAGIMYVGLLFAIATLYLPIAYIALAYAIAGLGYRLAKQVSLTVENLRRRRYNTNMDTRLLRGLKAIEAFRAVDNGDSVCFVAFQPNSPRTAEYDPIGIGAWSDGGRLHIEPCVILRDCEQAIQLARAEVQQCILQVSPEGEGRLYLIEDTPSNRALALLNAGGYTAIDGLLLIYSERHIPHFLFDGEVNFLPCKGVFLPIAE